MPGSSASPAPYCILLQGVHSLAFTVLRQDRWIQQHFHIYPVDPDNWNTLSGWNTTAQGNVTLVSKSIPRTIGSVTMQSRDSSLLKTVVFVDIYLRHPDVETLLRLRIANTHLDFWTHSGSDRAEQLTYIIDALYERDVHGGIIAGDMNVVNKMDARMLQDLLRRGLVDAYRGDEVSGATWGFQTPRWSRDSNIPPRGGFKPERQDQVYYTPSSRSGIRLQVSGPSLIGRGLCISNGEWASSHLGLEVRNVQFVH